MFTTALLTIQKVSMYFTNQYTFWPKENKNIDTAQFLTNTSQLHYACNFVVVDFYTALKKLFSILSRNVLLLRIATILVFSLKFVFVCEMAFNVIGWS